MASASLPPPVAPSLPAKPAPPPGRTGEFLDQGVVRRASLRAARWTLRGTAKVTGEVDVDTAVLAGIASVGGTITAGELRVDGSLAAIGDASVTHRLAVDGDFQLRGALHAGDIDAKGTVRVGGGVDVDRAVVWRGSLEVGGALKASRVAGEGSIEVGGVLAAKEVDLALDRPSSVRSIAAETVRVRLRRRPLRDPPFLELERIDADLVELEGVHVEYLRASQISAGAGCRIARFDGKVVRRHASARLGPSSISLRPHGLSR